jgi:shikimate dehydrogenase
MSTLPDQYGVIGHPVAHSLSPFIHGMFARDTGESMLYRMHDVPPERFRGFVLEFFARGGRGLNVTLPHKETAAQLVNDLTPRAERAGAVNTLMLLEENRILGDNTDGAGLINDLQNNLRVPIEQRRILILGAGGATRGVLAPLLMLKPSSILVTNRTPKRAHALITDFSDLGPVRACGFDELPPEAFDLIINGTSASLSGEVPQIDARVIGSNTVCYDMAYGKAQTPFVRWSLERGCARALQGLGMLVEQAAEAFLLWRSVRPATGPVLHALERMVQER